MIHTHLHDPYGVQRKPEHALSPVSGCGRAAVHCAPLTAMHSLLPTQSLQALSPTAQEHSPEKEPSITAPHHMHLTLSVNSLMPAKS